MVIGGLGLAIHGMLHQADHGLAERGPAVLGHDVLDGLAEVEGPFLRRRLLAERLAVQQHLCPAVAIKVVDGTAGADDKIPFLAQRPHHSADFDVVVGVIARVHADDRHGWAGRVVREHPDQHHERVVDPFEVGVFGRFESFTV